MRRWFGSRRGLECPGVATEYNLSKDIGDITVYIDLKMFELKVPIIFSGT